MRERGKLRKKNRDRHKKFERERERDGNLKDKFYS